MAPIGRRLTVEQRIQSRNHRNELRGKQAGWADEALEFYLLGVPVAEILACFSVNRNVFYTSIAKAALYRLMKERQAELMTDMEELK